MNIKKATKKEEEYHEEHASSKIETSILIDAYFQLKKITSVVSNKNRVLKILSETNQALIYSNDEKSLLDKVCFILTNYGGYQSVWIGFSEENEEKMIIPVSYAGFESGYLDSFNLTWAENERGRGPEAVSIRTGEIIIKRNIITDLDMVLWREDALKHGYQAVISLPLINKNKRLGVINIYSDKLEAFDDEEEVNTLKELSNDLTFGIVSRRILIEHKLLEEELLRVSSDRYKALFIASRDAVMTLEPPIWKFTSGNPATLEMFKIKSEGEFLSHEPWTLSPEFQSDGRKSSEKAKEMIDKAMTEGLNLFEWTHKRLNGEEFPAEVLLSKVEIEGNKFIHAVVRDVTQRKKLEAQLREYAEEKFKVIFESTNDGMLVSDIEGNHFTIANRAICEMLGYSQEELVKLSLLDIHPKENLDYVLDQFKKQVRGEVKIAKDMPVLRKDKSIFYADIGASDIIIEGKKYLLGVFRDITERKLAEESLKESEKMYYNLIENIPDAIAVYDIDGKIEFINKESLHLLGASDDGELIGKPVMKFIHPDSYSFVVERMKKSVKDKNILDLAEEKFLRLDGTSVHVEVKSMPIEFENKQSTLVIMRDITERKNLEESKISFLSVASHQLRTPLSMMKWVLDSLLEDKNLDSDKLKKYNNLYFANGKLINLVEKLIKVSILDQGKIIINKNSFDLGKLVYDLSLSLKPFSDKNNKIIKVITPSNISNVYCDQILINEVIKNLLVNAIIYSQKDSKEISITISERKNDYLISVHNEGFIESASLGKISLFDKFSRGSHSSEASPSGSGLGLYIAKKMVEANGGTIGFTSTANSGTTFYFNIIK